MIHYIVRDREKALFPEVERFINPRMHRFIIQKFPYMPPWVPTYSHLHVWKKKSQTVFMLAVKYKLPSVFNLTTS